jgi:chitodextrinase
MHTTPRRLSAFLAGIIFAAALASSAAGVAPSYTGELVSMHGDAFSKGRSVANRLLLQTADHTYLLAFDGRGPQQLVGRRVTVRGSLSNGKITVGSVQLAAAGGTGSTTTGTSTTVASTTKNVAVLLFNFQNDTRQPYTPAFASGVMFTNAASVANYFAEESFGQYAVSGAVFGWYTIPYDNTGCSYSTWATAARAAATAAGVTLGSYTNFVYAFPSASGCGWSGLAYLPGTETWNNNSMSLRTNAHELSHNFGVHHASTISCTESGVRVALSANQANCSLSEYGDPFTVMGAAQTRQSHAEHKAQMTWIPTGDRLDVTAAGTYTLGAEEQSSASPKVVRVARAGATNQYFYLDFRQPYGSYFDNFSSSDPAVTGVTIRVAADYSTRSQSWLVDTTPATTSYGDAPLAVGRTFSDPLSGVSITTVSVSTTGATVSISLGGGGTGADTQVPSAPTNLVASGTGTMTMGLSWTAATDNVGVAGYRVSRNGSQVATTTGTSWNDSGLTPATTYGYSVVAYDAAGNVSAAAVASGTTAADTQAPSAPTNLVAQAASATSASLSWSAASDNVGVAGYKVLRDGTQVATLSGTSWTDGGLTAGGSYQYAVEAYDAAGNVGGPATAAVTLSAGDTVAPTSPILTVTVNSRRQTKASWTASTDNVKVAGYRVYQNGVLVATTTRRSWSPTRVSGTFTYYVVAFDAAGNVSLPSNSVTVTVP